MSNHHEEHVEYGGKRKTLKAYVTGFILCLMLTLAAFGIVEKRIFSDANIYISLGVLAIAQLVVQSICFLGLNNSEEGKWNLQPFLFAIFVIASLVGGSIWIMYNLNYYMMN